MTRAARPSAAPRDISHVIVLGNPDAASFSHAVANAYRDAVIECGQQAVVRDLYAMHFDPLLKADERPGRRGTAPAADVVAEIDLVRDASVITLVYPLWYGLPPAIIKGYIDRVLGAGFSARDIVAGSSHGLLHGKRFMSFSSSASTRPWLEEHGQWVSIRQALDTYLATIFALEEGGHVHFDAIVEGVSEQYVAECLADVRERARRTCSHLLSNRHHQRQRALLHTERL
ncbi:NAD(P)H-dependent oxidoreductase [Sphingomonas hylomeconis]|uniref:NAD(P)H-dependent oxidoreductase n=1 Tax=Sphingomonas hylomeconis TaxID=1395958 RepID=A0ABV7SVI0_9SPHN|nr:NAD(P)H-dependent oxidoreductase [Sphingomonas hylomeconis]